MRSQALWPPRGGAAACRKAPSACGLWLPRIAHRPSVSPPRASQRIHSQLQVQAETVGAEYVLERLRKTSGLAASSAHNQEAVVSGIGRHLGINIQWQVRWREDGAFQESLRGRELSFEWGYDGGSANTWELDSSGVARALEKDDHEALLVGVWVRTGLWFRPDLTQALDIQLVPPDIAKDTNSSPTSPSTSQPDSSTVSSPSSTADTQHRQPHATSQQGARSMKAADTATATAPQNSASSGSTGVREGTRPRRVGRRKRVAVSAAATTTPAVQQPHSQQPQSAQSAQSASHASDSDTDMHLGSEGQDSTEEPPALILSVRLRKGRMVHRVRVCPVTWEVLGLDQQLCGDVEVWQYATWRDWGHTRVMFPEHVSHQAVAGGRHVYVAQTCRVALAGPDTHYQCPSTPLLPVDTSFEPDVPPEVPVWRAGSGHLLIKPSINGQEGGYMALDTGASGFVITPTAAEELGLESFGKLYAASISGKVPARFVRARDWSLGPLHISQPVLMTMAVEGLVSGGPEDGKVIGIVGYDVFRRAVIELPQMDTSDDSSQHPVTHTSSQHTSQPPHAASTHSPSQSTHSSDHTLSRPVSPFQPHAAASTHHSQPQSATQPMSATSQPHLSPHSTPHVSPQVTITSQDDSAERTGDTSVSVATTSTSEPAPPPRRRPLRLSPLGCEQFTMRVLNPVTYDTQKDGAWSWHTFHMISSLPHVEVNLQGSDGRTRTALLMVDSGACGADIMLHARAMQDLDLHDLTRPMDMYVRGVGGGGSKSNVRVASVDLDWADMAGIRFREVRCMSVATGALDISLYSAGIVCGDLLARVPVCFDYARKRLAFGRSALT